MSTNWLKRIGFVIMVLPIVIFCILLFTPPILIWIFTGNEEWVRKSLDLCDKVATWIINL